MDEVSTIAYLYDKGEYTDADLFEMIEQGKLTIDEFEHITGHEFEK